MRRSIITVVVLVAVLAAITVAFVGCGKEKGNVVKIGVILPLTGDYKAFGVEMLNAAKLAVDEWNEQNKMPGGYTIEIVERDDAGNKTTALNQAKYVVSDPQVYGVLAHLNSGCLIAALKTYSEENIVAIGPSESNPDITKKGYRNIFRLVTHDLHQGGITAEYLHSRGIKKLAIIHNSNDYGKPLAVVIKKRAEELGIEVLAFIATRVEDVDYSTVLTEIKSKTPDAIYFSGEASQAGDIVKQARSMGITQRFFTPDGTFGKQYIKIAGVETVEGNVVSMFGPPIDVLKGEAGHLFEKYRQKYNTEIVNFGPYAYDVTQILLTAIKNTIDKNGKPSRKAVIEEVRNIKYKGVIGTTTFDEFGDTKNRIITFYEIRNGEYTPQKVWRPQPD